jgi:ribonuclease HII
MAYALVCGVDEVGRGSLAGPLLAVAASFWAEPGTPTAGCWSGWAYNKNPIEGVKDSKAFVNRKKRETVYHRILDSHLLFDFGIGEVSVEEINKNGIDEANQEAFRRALADLSRPPPFVIVDGNRAITGWSVDHQFYQPKADSRWWPVSAASILAKVIRDEYMEGFSRDFPYYGWERNSGYGSEEHIHAIKKFGPSKHHRKQFIRNILGRSNAW